MCVLCASMCVFVVVYLIFGAGACLRYRDPAGAITENFPKNSMYRAVVSCGCCQVLFTYPIVIYVVNSILEAEFETWFKHRHALRVIVVLSTCVVAASVEKLGDFLSLVGCVGNSCNIFILPNLCVLVGIPSSELTLWDRIS